MHASRTLPEEFNIQMEMYSNRMLLFGRRLRLTFVFSFAYAKKKQDSSRVEFQVVNGCEWGLAGTKPQAMSLDKHKQSARSTSHFPPSLF